MTLTLCSLLLGTSLIAFLLALAGHNLSKHHHTIAIHESNAREALAILEGVGNEWLLRLERALGHLVGLQCMRLIHLLATGLLAHLPLECRDTAGCASTTHETNWGVAHLNFVRDVEDLDLGIELLGLTKCSVLLVNHHISTAWHVILVESLDVQAHV